MDVTAEGVETPQQIESLSALNCRRAQGYYFSRPMPAPEAERLIAEGAPTYWTEPSTREDARRDK
jgi:EAL domain-containing protein (putative c-di-GMP-specific phosphodiesterase class I)